MPTDLQASTSSTTSMCKQNSTDETSSNYSLDKSREESTLSKELYLANISNDSSINANYHCNNRFCCTPKDVACVYENGVNDNSNFEICKIFCSNPKCDQSGWIHLACIKIWEQRIRSEVMCLRPQLRAFIDRQINSGAASSGNNNSCSTSGGSSIGGNSTDNSSAMNSTNIMEVLSNVLPNSFLCRCNLGNLIRLDLTNCSNAQRSQLLESNTHSFLLSSMLFGTTQSGINSNTNNNTRRKISGSNPSANISSSPSSNSNASYNPSNLNNPINRKTPTEMPCNFNNFNKRMRSRTLSANQMMASQLSEHAIGLHFSPYEFTGPHQLPTNQNNSKKSDQSQQINKQTQQQQSQQHNKPTNGMIVTKNNNKSNGGNGGKSNFNRQRHHSSCYHGTKDEFNFIGGNNGSNQNSGINHLIVTNSAGNIFKQRSNFNNFQRLPFAKQNAYFIQMEDDSCTGNDDTKVFLLGHLSQANKAAVDCLICGGSMPVYDHLPLIDGTFFLSPVCHSTERAIVLPHNANPPPGTATNNNMHQPRYLHAVCVSCMHEIVICCQNCHRPWTGAQLLVGSLYTYDVFAAVPCCPSRLTCNKCRQICVVKDNNSSGNTPTASNNSKSQQQSTNENSANSKTPTLASLLANFSQLSRSIECIHCHTKDYHFVKPFLDIFKPITISSN